MKSNKIEHQQHIEESVEYILENKTSWTQFTRWAREKYHINNRQANDLWKKSWDVLTEDFEENIRTTVNQTMTELEQIKEDARDNGDRRIWLETVKYQNKIRGGEVERSQVDINVKSVDLSWGTTEEKN